MGELRESRLWPRQETGAQKYTILNTLREQGNNAATLSALSVYTNFLICLSLSLSLPSYHLIRTTSEIAVTKPIACNHFPSTDPLLSLPLYPPFSPPVY